MSSKYEYIKKYKIHLLIAIVTFILGWSLGNSSDDVLALKNESSLVVSEQKTLLEKIQDKKRLDVVIVNSPTIYYKGSQQELGFEYELISAFAKDIGVDLNLTVVNTVAQALQKSRDGVGDITVAGLSVTQEREKEFKFGPRYFGVTQELVCHNSMYKNKTIPKELKDLVGLKITVGKGTSFEQTLLELKKELSGFDFNTSLEFSTEDLLEEVDKQNIDCTVADSNIFMINQRYHPKLVKTLTLSDRESLAWILREGDDSLKNRLFRWLNRYTSSGKMEETEAFYYAYLGVFDYYDTTVFTKRMKKLLPKYKKYFKEAAKKYDLPWELLAAQSYQESHWNPKAKSYTGVRGMMMLTQSTAKELGVKNRLNVRESILGGAKYLKQLEKRLSKEIKGKTRLEFALAAYNVGMGHIHDAQTLAKKLNKNPYSFKDIKAVLPLLTQKKYYKSLKYGYARGNEPVHYVNSIHGYLDIIMKNEAK